MSPYLQTKPHPLAVEVSHLWLVWLSPRAPTLPSPSLGLHYLVTGFLLWRLISHLHACRTGVCLPHLSDPIVRPEPALVWDSSPCGHRPWSLPSLEHSSVPISPERGHPGLGRLSPHMGTQTQVIPPTCIAFPTHFYVRHLPSEWAI